ncbi:MAG: S24 family peptidase, partial [Bacillota bacterium]|nr:S24 family peptidase [Bacillota bacterium]
MELDSSQKKFIKSKITHYNILKGHKDSGKTIAAIYRVIYLKNNYCIYEQDKILVTAYSEGVLNKFNNLYTVFDEESKSYYLTLFSNMDHKLSFYTLSNIISEYFLEYNNSNGLQLKVLESEKDKAVIINECLNEVKKIYPRMKILDNKYVSFFIDEIKWIKSCNYMNLETYQTADRTGMKFRKSVGPQRLFKNSKQREAVFKIMLLYNEELKKNNLIDNEDKVILALEQVKKYANEKYTHIVVCDSEKFTKVQLDIIDALNNNYIYSNIIFILDYENTDSSSWFIKGRKTTNLQLKYKPKYYCFKKSYGTLDEFNKNTDSCIENTDNSIENFKYYDLRHRKNFEFERDMNDISNIILSEKDGRSEYISEEMNELPVFNDIAAGEPILMNPEVEGTFYIPKLWLKGIKDCFILKVKGDSMINADIDDGDYVLIKKQPFAENNDIIAADLDGSAT